MKNIFITGRPGVGKTTLIKKLAGFYGKSAGGFYTQEVKRNKERMGFDIIALSGEKGRLARGDYRSKFRLGKYGVNLADLERVGLKAMDEAIEAKEIVVIDEIGKMELFSQSFKDKVVESLNSPKKVLAVISLAGDEFVEGLKICPRVKMFRLTRDNSEEIYGEIVKTWEKK
ncbi:MAG: NTPase [Candidatus Ratteibacteria bacterium]|nr:NTPase [Candidatus Ratteibacteria bacterium]